MKEIIFYTTKDNKCPYKDWLNKLDKSVRVKIAKRLDRVEEGNYGNFKWIDEEISELRFSFGKGYRIYFTEQNESLVILLCGGDKSNQTKQKIF